jgi:hypothetical protein
VKLKKERIKAFSMNHKCGQLQGQGDTIGAGEWQVKGCFSVETTLEVFL